MFNYLFGGLRRGLENPSTPLSDPDDWAWDMQGAGKSSHSGVRVNRKTALNSSHIFRGVSLISTAVAKLPFIVHERDGDGKRDAKTHPAYRLLKYKANDEQTAYVFKMTLQAHAILMGGGFAYIVRNGDGSPRELIPLLPDATWPIRVNGVLRYVTTIKTDIPGDTRSEMIKLKAEDVFHLHGLGWDGMTGYSLIKLAADSIGLSLASERYAARYFKNSARPSVVIEVPSTMKEPAFKRLKDSWQALHSGIENAHKVAILENGAKVNPFSINARDSQLIDSRKFDIVSAANWLGLPVHKLGGEGRTSYNSLEQENQSFLDDALDSWLVNWEQEAREKLATEEQKRTDSHVFEYRRQALVRGDLSKRGAFYRLGLGGRPFLKMNEVRGWENLNPVDGGDVILDPLNMKPAGKSGDDKDKKSSDDVGGSGHAMAHERLLIDSLRRVCRRIAHKAGRAATRSKAFPAFLAGFSEENVSICREMVEPAAAAAAGDVESDDFARQIVDELFDAIRVQLEEIYDLATPAEFPAAVKKCVDELSESAPADYAKRLIERLKNDEQDLQSAA